MHPFYRSIWRALVKKKFEAFRFSRKIRLNIDRWRSTTTTRTATAFCLQRSYGSVNVLILRLRRLCVLVMIMKASLDASINWRRCLRNFLADNATISYA